MQVINLGKLRLQMTGEWSPEKQYESNDVVRYGGNLYVYHYQVKQAGHLPTNAARFSLMLPGTAVKGVYNSTTSYLIGEAVTFGGGMYRASEDIEPGQSPEVAPSRWVKISDVPSYKGEWAPGTEYRPGDLVTFAASTYACQVGHVGSPSFEQDATKWASYMRGLRYMGLYAAGAEYQVGDLVSNGLHIMAAKVSMTAPAEMEMSNWEIAVRGADYLPSMLGKDGMFLSNEAGNPQWKTVDLSLTTNLSLLAQIQAQLQTI